jgi:Leucine-rich repeat (LRR) protein
MKELPASIIMLKNLVELDLGENPDIDYSTAFNLLSGLPKLESLWIQFNSLEKMPDSIAKLKNLKEIGLMNNNFSDDELNRIQKMLPGTKLLW